MLLRPVDGPGVGVEDGLFQTDRQANSDSQWSLLLCLSVKVDDHLFYLVWGLLVWSRWVGDHHCDDHEVKYEFIL